MTKQLDLSEMTLNDVDQVLFEGASDDVAGPEQVAQLLEDAGLQPEAPAPEPTVETPAPEPTPEITEPPSSDPMQQYLAQQQQLNEQMLTLQQQIADHQQKPPQQQQFDPNDTNQIVQYMEQIGLDPSDPAHVYMFRSDYERRQNEAHYAQQIQSMSEHVNYMQNQASQANNEAALAPKVGETMKAYGEIPAETLSNIQAQAATIMTQAPNQYTEAQAIELAVKPYLPLLQALKGREHPQQPAPTAVQPEQQQAVLAAALSGRSSGHGPAVSELTLADLEKKLFS